MNLKIAKSLLVISAVCVLCYVLESCNLSPPVPELREEPVEALKNARDEALTEASFISDGWLNEEWWLLFDDPQLENLIGRALDQNPSIDAAEARIGKALALAAQAHAPRYPNVDFEADTTRVHESPNSVFGILHASNPAYPITYRQNNMTLSFSYRFDFFRKYYHQIAAALDEVEALKAEAYISRLNLSLSVANSYFQWQIDEARTILAKRLVEVRESIFTLIEQKGKQGLINRSDSSRSANDLLNARQFVNNLSRSSANSGNQLQALIAENFVTSIEPVEVEAFIPFPLPASLPLNLLAHRPDVWAHRWRVEGAAMQISAARADFYPNVDIKGFIGLQALSYTPFWSWNSVAGLLVGPAVHLPIFDGGVIRTTYDIRYQEYYLAIAQYDDCVLNAIKEVLNAMVNLQKADENYQAAIEAEAITKSNFEDAQLLVKQKISSRIDLLTSEDQFLQTIDSRLQAYQICLQARLDLINALGGGYGICTNE